jgi:hypothetical protein
MKPKRSNDEMHRGIDALATVVPNGQLMAALGPLPFLGAAAECIAATRAEAERLREALGVIKRDAHHHPGCRANLPNPPLCSEFCAVGIASRALGEQPKETT